MCAWALRAPAAPRTGRPDEPGGAPAAPPARAAGPDDGALFAAVDFIARNAAKYEVSARRRMNK